MAQAGAGHDASRRPTAGSRRGGALAAGLVLLFLLASARPALAQFPWAGARSTGMAGAATAAVDDNSAIYSNPAALGALKGWGFQLLAGGMAQNRNNLVGTIVTLSDLPWEDIANGSRPDLVIPALAGIANLAREDTAVIASGAVGLVVSYGGFAFSIGDIPYAGIYPVIDLQHTVPGGGPGNGLAFNTTGLYFVGLSGREARLAYGAEMAGGAFEFGGALRFVSGVTYFDACGLVGDLSCEGQDLSDLIRDAFEENARTTNKLTFDFGARFKFGILKLGFVGVALNQPEFTVADVTGSPGRVPLPRQVRGGVSLDPLSFLTLTVDGDLIKSDTLVPERSAPVLAPGSKSQQLSLGAEVRVPIVAFRLGASRDFAAANPNWSYAFGLGIGVPTFAVDLAIVWGPTGGLNWDNPNRETLGGSAGVRFRF